MKMMNILVWIFTGAVIGWFVSRMVKVEFKKTPNKIIPVKDLGSKKS
jgi:hypothetical protein